MASKSMMTLGIITKKSSRFGEGEEVTGEQQLSSTKGIWENMQKDQTGKACIWVPTYSSFKRAIVLFELGNPLAGGGGLMFNI